MITGSALLNIKTILSSGDDFFKTFSDLSWIEMYISTRFHQNKRRNFSGKRICPLYYKQSKTRKLPWRSQSEYNGNIDLRSKGNYFQFKHKNSLPKKRSKRIILLRNSEWVQKIYSFLQNLFPFSTYIAINPYSSIFNKNVKQSIWISQSLLGFRSFCNIFITSVALCCFCVKNS